jgi:hypothetical protein
MDDGRLSLFLTLPHGLEESFWAAPRTRQQLAQSDRWGLLIGIAAHSMGAAVGLEPLNRLVFAATVAAQLAQLLWLHLAAASYARHRATITVVQRLRWMLVKFLTSVYTPGLEARMARNHFSGGEAPGVRALAATTLLSPLMLLLSSLNHALPLRWGRAAGPAACPFAARAPGPAALASGCMPRRRWCPPPTAAAQPRRAAPVATPCTLIPRHRRRPPARPAGCSASSCWPRC